VSAFPDELFQCPRNWAERAYPKLIHYNKLDKGGQQLFTSELRAGSNRYAATIRQLRIINFPSGLPRRDVRRAEKMSRSPIAQNTDWPGKDAASPPRSPLKPDARLSPQSSILVSRKAKSYT
jgi:hypothetical protein